jgi:hypothetical protein
MDKELLKKQINQEIKEITKKLKDKYKAALLSKEVDLNYYEDDRCLCNILTVAVLKSLGDSSKLFYEPNIQVSESIRKTL